MTYPAPGLPTSGLPPSFSPTTVTTFSGLPPGLPPVDSVQPQTHGSSLQYTQGFGGTRPLHHFVPSTSYYPTPTTFVPIAGGPPPALYPVRFCCGSAIFVLVAFVLASIFLLTIVA